MNIKFTIGVKNIQDLKEIKKKGINTIYCGYLENKIIKKCPEAFCILNRRGEKASIYGRRKFKSFILEAEKYDISVYITFNGFYTTEQYDWLLDLINYTSSFNAVKGVIVGDMGLLLRLHKINYKKHIVISTGGTTFNSATVSFYKQFGITRIVLDRQLKSDEIISILKNHRDINFEIFIFFDNCLFVDGYCSFLHTLETQEQDKKYFYSVNKDLTMCGIIYSTQISNKYKVINSSKNKYEIKLRNDFKGPVTGCNLCKISKLQDFLETTMYKIVSRGNIFIEEMDMIKPYLDKIFYIENSKDRIFLFKKLFNYDCNKTGCYANEEII